MATLQKNKVIDAAIVGAGPVGSFAALSLAKKNIEVTVFEEHPIIGLPAHCAGHISIKSLKNFGLYPLPEDIIENIFSAANFYSPKGTKFSLRLSSPVTVAVNRAKFDQYLAKQAQKAGAQFVLNSHVESLIFSDGYTRGLTVKRRDGTKEQINSKMVLDAEGISSRLIRETGLRPLKTNGLVYAVEAEIENVHNVELHTVEVYFGKDYAPGFYGWLIPKLDGTAKIGLATNNGDPRNYLRRLMFKHPVASKKLSKAKITQSSYHALTLGGPLEKTYVNGFLAMGDCASQVKPTTGGGVIFGLTCAKIAAEVTYQALRNEDTSDTILQVYQNRCNNALNFNFKVMLRLRRFLDKLSDEKIDDMLNVCGLLGVDKALVNVDEIDFQGKLLLALLVKPSVLATLGYFSLLYLSANP